MVSAAGQMVENRNGLSEAEWELLWQDLGQLKPAADARAAMQYVVDGLGKEVLAKFAQTPKHGQALGLQASTKSRFTGNEARQTLFAKGKPEHAAIYLRLAEVYEAATRRERKPGDRQTLPTPVALLLEELAGPLHHLDDPNSSLIPAELAQRMVVLAGGTEDALLCAVFRVELNRYGMYPQARVIQSMRGFGDLVGRYPEVVRGCLEENDAERRCYVLDVLKSTRTTLEPFAAQIVNLATCGQKTVRTRAAGLLNSLKDLARPLLETVLAKGGIEERVAAAEELSRLYGEDVREVLTRHKAAEKHQRVQTALQAVIGSLAACAETAVPRQGEPRIVRMTEECRKVAARVPLEQYEEIARDGVFEPGPRPTDKDAAEFVRLLEEWTVGEAAPERVPPLRTYSPLITAPGLNAAHLVRWVWLTTDELARRNSLARMLQRRMSKEKPLSLREIAAGLEACGINPDEAGMLIFACSDRPTESPLLKLPAEAIWPYFADRPHVLKYAWESDAERWQDLRRQVVLHILAMFKEIPAALQQLLWSAALSGGKECEQARTMLAKAAGKVERIITGLDAATAQQRAAAADWLAELGAKEALPALERAAKKEKAEPAKSAMARAMQRLGTKAEGLDLAAARKEAAKVGEVPEKLGWFDFGRVPKVRWTNGKAVEAEILRWMVIKAAKGKQVEPTEMMCQVTAGFEAGDRQRFGQYVLESWIEEDTGVSADASSEELDRVVDAHQYAAWRAQKTRSAADSKGIMAVAAACCGEEAVPVIQRYIKAWYGWRVGGCRALIGVLAWVECPTAVQALLAISARFRTASIRKEAQRCVEQMAQRKGWTPDELGDHTIPTAGFDAQRQRVLDYGSRSFAARLNADLQIELVDASGRKLKTAPEPTADDDAEKAAAAKKALQAAKKEVAGIVKMQTQRLYDAMCAGRTWTAKAWRNVLLAHPIAGILCGQLVWASGDGKGLMTFRPMEDGTLTNAADEAVKVADDQVIRLAHECIVPDRKIGATWLEHMADYEITPLFAQFGLTPYEPTQEQVKRITRFRAYEVEAFKLRGILTKRGYVRGQTQDGGGFYWYERTLTSLGIKTIIEFSGNRLPETNLPVALVSLYFRKTNQGVLAGDAPDMLLSDVPPILLAECYNDLATVAASGPGRQARWEEQLRH